MRIHTETPKEMTERLRRTLTINGQQPFVQVVARRLETGWKCTVAQADVYEIYAYYPVMGDALGSLETVLAAVPGVFMTTQVVPVGPSDNRATNEDWPAKFKRRGEFKTLRPQVRALWRPVH